MTLNRQYRYARGQSCAGDEVAMDLSIVSKLKWKPGWELVLTRAINAKQDRLSEPRR